MHPLLRFTFVFIVMIRLICLKKATSLSSGLMDLMKSNESSTEGFFKVSFSIFKNDLIWEINPNFGVILLFSCLVQSWTFLYFFFKDFSTFHRDLKCLVAFGELFRGIFLRDSFGFLKCLLWDSFKILYLLFSSLILVFCFRLLISSLPSFQSNAWCHIFQCDLFSCWHFRYRSLSLPFCKNAHVDLYYYYYYCFCHCFYYYFVNGWRRFVKGLPRS